MTRRYTLIAFFTLFAALSFGYSLFMPVWEAPDETAHYQYILHLIENSSLPTYDDTPEAGQPPLYYLLASIPLGVMQRLDPALTAFYAPPSLRDQVLKSGGERLFDWTPENFRWMPGVLILRWLNIGVGLLAVLFIYRGALLFTGDRFTLSLAAAALIGLTPQFLHMSAAVNNDPLAYLAGAVMFWLFGMIVVRGLSPPWLLVSGLLAFTVPILIKFTAVPVGLVVGTAALVKLRPNIQFRRYWGLIIGSAAVLAAGAGWLLFGTGFGAQLQHELGYRLGTVRPDLFSRSIVPYLNNFSWSFWGTLGWNRVGIPQDVHVGLSCMALAGLLMAFHQTMAGTPSWLRKGFAVLLFLPAVLILRPFIRPFSLTFLATGMLLWYWEVKNITIGRREVWAVLWLLVIAAALAFARNFITTPKVDGRFLYPAAGGLTTLVVLGWDRLTGARSALIPVLIVLILLWINLHLWSVKILPLFYQPFLD